VLDAAQRRARLGRRHGLAAAGASSHTDAATAVDAINRVVDDLVVLHATDPATIYLSVHARLPGVTVEQIDQAMFERRSLLRTLAMRRTLFVATTDGLPAVELSSSGAVADAERARLEKFLADSGIDEPSAWLAAAFDEVLAVLDDEGMTARQLTKAAPRLATRILMGAGTKHPVEAGATSRVLGLMAVEGLICRGRPTGDWTNRTYRWHRRDRWFDGADPSAAISVGGGTEHDASVELLTRWLRRFGPATVEDMKWWTGWTMTKTRRTLVDIETAEMPVLADDPADQVDGTEPRDGFVLADDREPVDDPGPWAALLPSLDPTAMGWKHRGWYLGRHQPELFDRNGNIGPTIWIDGRIVGGWSQRPDGEVVTELLEPVGPDHQMLIAERITALARFLDGTVVRPSFPTPLQKRLSGSG
jgi:hypothetical protein